MCLRKEASVIEPQWDKYPLVAHLATARAWLQIQADLGRAAHTVDAYGRDLEDYLQVCARLAITARDCEKDQIARYVRDLSQRPNPRRAKVVDRAAGAGLSNATMQRRITVLRLYYDYLMEEAIRTTNPVGRGRYRPGTGFGGQRDRGLIPHYQKVPDSKRRPVAGDCTGRATRTHPQPLYVRAGLRYRHAP